MQAGQWVAKVLTVSCAVVMGLAATAPAQGVVVRTLQQDVFAGEVHSLEIDLGIGNITIEGTDGRDVEVEVDLTCGRENEAKCRQRAERIRLVPRRNKGLLKVRLKGTPRGRAGGISAEMRLKIPRRLAIELDLQAGNVTLSQMQSHLEVDVTAGDVDITGNQADLSEVKLAVGVGKADLWLEEGRIEGTGFPRSLSWHGDGTAEWEVDIGTGDVSVRLE